MVDDDLKSLAVVFTMSMLAGLIILSGQIQRNGEVCQWDLCPMYRGCLQRREFRQSICWVHKNLANAVERLQLWTMTRDLARVELTMMDTKWQKIRLPENDYIVKSQNVLSFLKDFIPFNGAATNGDVLHCKRAVCYTAHYRLGSGIILAEDNKRKKNENLVFHGKLKSLNGGNFYHLPER